MTVNNNVLPVAILSPHGGLGIPPELNGRIALTPEQIFNEADAYIDDIFNFSDRVLYYETFPYARCIIDLNRPREHGVYHRRGDGIIKEHSSYGDQVFHSGHEPDEAEREALINKYWCAWHAKLDAIAQDERVKLVIDAHSMAGVGPSHYENPNQIRPRLMVGNMGNADGQPRQNLGFTTASSKFTFWFAESLGNALESLEPWSRTGQAWAVNQPYWGGWDIWAHGKMAKQPWLMVEVSRAMYIGEQTATTPIVPQNPERTAALRNGIWSVIEKAVEEMLG